MTRLPFTTIAYVCTTRTDTQNAHYPVRDGQILRFQLQWNYSRRACFMDGSREPCLANSVP